MTAPFLEWNTRSLLKKTQEALAVCSSAVTLGQGLKTCVDVMPGGAPGLEPGMLLNVPQCPEHPLPTE